ncbi:MAG: HK97 gp10 family phage protein [Ignavibacterium sp.]|nr:HK97 gp10 family phage protein [Ignavibacterium sp.]
MEWNADKISKLVKQYYSDKMEVACELLETDMKEKTSGAQGPELKAVDLGNYLNSFTHKVIEGDDEVVGLVANSADYAPYIEFGTGELAESGDGRKGGWYYKDPEGNWHFTLGMRPRPIMRAALIEKKQEILELFRNN